MNRQNASRVGGAVFLIGLGIIAFLNYWWPGIMFVIAASLLASEFSETGGEIKLARGRVIGAGIMILIGLIDFININWGQLWPIVLILIGVGLLFGRGQLPSMRSESDLESEKPKRSVASTDDE